MLLSFRRSAPPTRLGRRLLPLLAGSLLLGAGCATLGSPGKKKEEDLLTGSVRDPGGRAIPFAKISVEPKAPYDNPEGNRGALRRKKQREPLPDAVRGLAVTTEGGRWKVDHLSTEEGESLGLPGGYFYEVTVYMAGYHTWKDSVLYERGTLQVDVTLYPDTIDIEDVGNLVETDVDAEDTNTGTGVTRQGE
ncbi:MAG: carboxypeptidase-like regulatory domain-containing protein [Myxococcota bacterium]|nr:carboxypeptidase-like regulatory domain-containing protein [Myxococcota bacterium]